VKIIHNVIVQVEEPVVYSEDYLLQRAALKVLEMHNLEQSSELIIVISDDETLQELNRRFRGIDAPTDVLSFANDNRGPYAAVAVNFPQHLGDIVISIDTARRQASDVGADLASEMQLLVVHGTLHLLGYDHETKDDKHTMWAVQKHILQTLDIDIKLPE
jgi:probable rRNA maturation factor